MTVFTVDAERSPGGVWVLECKELGVVSQTENLELAEAEVREAIAFQSGLRADEFEVEVAAMEP